MESAQNPEATIEQALVRLVRRATDPRGNARLNERAGVDLERSGATLLARIVELQPVRLGDIADVAGIEPSTASRQVGRLVKQGYVLCEADPNDRRASVHRLTPLGHRVYERVLSARHEWLDDVLEGFSTVEREQLAGLLDRFVERIITVGQEPVSSPTTRNS